ncbi:MAG: MBL fold metallo-hydrolase [Cyanobacteria bacterium J06635_15]
MRIGQYRVLLDCGLTDWSLSNSEPRSQEPVDFVLCSHAHADHARGMLAFHQRFPQIPVYSSEVTAQLLPLNWLGQTDAADASFCQGLPWRSQIALADGLSVQLWPAGHLPGAACFLLRYQTPERTYQVFYTGDFFLSNSRLVEGLPLEELRGLNPDVLLLEGSYGTSRYPHRRQQENQLAERINQALAAQTSVILPTPALGLGQELLMFLRSHHHFTGRKIDIWVDETVAAGCDAYLELLPYFPSSVQNFARHQPLFWDERVLPRVKRLPPEGLADVGSPAIVIVHRSPQLMQWLAASSLDWVAFLPDIGERRAAPDQKDKGVEDKAGAGDDGGDDRMALSSTTVWQQLQQQLQHQTVAIEPYVLTTHCDGAGTTQLIHNLRPQHVVFIHGTRSRLADLTNLEELQSRYQLHLPATGHLVELPIGTTFLQPAAPELLYEGELTEAVDGVNIVLPLGLNQAEQWSTFGDTGVIEARWQGSELVLRGLSQDELLQQGYLAEAAEADVENCARCTYLHNARCTNQASPMLGFKVSLNGYCPGFAPKGDQDKDSDSPISG